MKTKFKKLVAIFMAVITAVSVLPLQAVAASWGIGDIVYSAMYDDYYGSDGDMYRDLRDYPYIRYVSANQTTAGYRTASSHAKISVSKGGVYQQVICIEAGVALDVNVQYEGIDGNNCEYLSFLPDKVHKDIKLALLCGFNSDTTNSPVANTNLDDFSFATQVIVWEIQQQLRTGYGKSDLKTNSVGTPAKVFYEQLKDRPAEKCYDWILSKMASYGKIPSFATTNKATAPVYKMAYNQTTRKYSVTLTDTNNSGMPASTFSISGVTVTKSGNKYTFTTSSKITTQRLASYTDNRIDCSANPFVVWQVKDPSLDYQLMAAGLSDPVQFFAYFLTEDRGNGRILKVWNSVESLTQAEKIALGKYVYFTVKNANGKYVSASGGTGGVYTYSGTSTTAQKYRLNTTSIAFRIDDMPTGKYTITEYNNTPGYSPATQSKEITVTNGETAEVSFTNTQDTGDGRILKVWNSVESLTQAEKIALGEYVYFTVKNANGKYVSAIGGTGGVYTYSGTSTTAQKYKLNTTSIAFRIDDMPAGKYTVTEYNTAPGYSPKTQSIILNITKGKTAEVSFTNTLDTGSVEITKQFLNVEGNSETVTDEQLSDISFVIKNQEGKPLTFSGSNGNYSYEGVSDGSGTKLKLSDTYKLFADELPAHKQYTAEEVSGTTGYSFTIDPITFEIKANETTSKVFYNKAQTGYITIKKRSADGKLSGWKFRVQLVSSPFEGYTYDKTFTTDAYGVISIGDLRVGKYKVSEVSSGIAGYITPSNQTVEIKYNEVTSIEMQNLPYGHIKIQKVNKKTGEKVSGATFAIYESNGKTPAKAFKSATDKTLVDAVITETPEGSGIYVCNYLPITATSGTKYVIKETSAPEGYILDNGSYTVTLDTADEIVPVSNNGTDKFIEDEYGHAQIIKKWVAPAQPTEEEIKELEKQVYFTVQDAQGNYLRVNGTDGSYTYSGIKDVEARFMLSDGKFSIAMLPTGTYTVTEYNNAPGYSPAVQEVTISVKRNQTAVAEFVNTRDTGTAEINKKWTAPVSLTEEEIKELEKHISFTVKDKDNKYLIVSGNNGVYSYAGVQEEEARFVIIDSVFKIENLPTGTYIVTEYNSLENYSPKEQYVTVHVTKDSVESVEFINDRDTGEAEIVKIWQTSASLSKEDVARLEKDVMFTVKDKDGRYFKVGTVKNGKYIFEGVQEEAAYFKLINSKIAITNVPTGEYEVTEINNAPGYLPKTETVKITVTKDTATKIEFTNKAITGNVEIIKVDEDYPDVKLTGAEFTIFEMDKKTVVGKLTEVEKGVYRYDGLLYGEYYLQETKAPEYFIRDVNFYYFQIVNDGETVNVTNTEIGKGTFINSPATGTIKVVKTAYDGKVAGIQFRITGTEYSTGKTYDKLFTTDEKGVIEVEFLRAGEYTVHEEENAELKKNYLLAEDQTVIISKPQNLQLVKMHNHKKPDNPDTGVELTVDTCLPVAMVCVAGTLVSGIVIVALDITRGRKRKHK